MGGIVLAVLAFLGFIIVGNVDKRPVPPNSIECPDMDCLFNGKAGE